MKLLSKNSKEKKILFFYRYGCKRCKVALPYLLEHISSEDKESIYFIDISSKRGKKLAQYYNVNSAATVVVSDQDGYKEYPLTSIKKGKAVIDFETISQVIDIVTSH